MEQLEFHEGCVLTPYRDSVKVLTIGIGRNLERGITRDEALFLLSNDIDRSINEIRAKFHWYDLLSDTRKRVIVDMVFNLGIYRFSKFKKTISFIEREEYKEAATEMLDSKWAIQVGERAGRLAKMMETDEVYSK